MITFDQVSGLLRQVVPLLGGIAIARGWINVEQLTLITGAILSVAGVVWSLFANSQNSILRSTAAMDEVTKVVLNDKAVADAVPSSKVDTK